MKAKTKKILAALSQAGSNSCVVWTRKLKTLRDVPCVVEKFTSAVVVSGVDYANRKNVREGIESGERGEVQALPWGEWLEFSLVIGHTKKGTSDYAEYIRLYPLSEAQMDAFPAFKPKTLYFIDGAPATADECKKLCLASEFRTDDKPIECFTLNVDAVQTVNGVNMATAPDAPPHSKVQAFQPVATAMRADKVTA